MKNATHELGTIFEQGDLTFEPVAALPAGLAETDDRVVAHSETGHHHTLDPVEACMARIYTSSDPMTCYLQVTEGFADVVHHRAWDTHETIRIPPGIYRIDRQREGTPSGWRRVED